jgi:hypothetical protein
MPNINQYLLNKTTEVQRISQEILERINKLKAIQEELLAKSYNISQVDFRGTQWEYLDSAQFDIFIDNLKNRNPDLNTIIQLIQSIQ